MGASRHVAGCLPERSTQRHWLVHRDPTPTQQVVAPGLAAPGQAVVAVPTPAQQVVAPHLATPGLAAVPMPTKQAAAPGLTNRGPISIINLVTAVPRLASAGLPVPRFRAHPDHSVQVYHAAQGGNYLYKDARESWDPTFHLRFEEPN